MGRFYRFGSGIVRPFPEASVPIVRQAAVVPPEALPVGSVQPASPQGFAPYEIRPEVIGHLPEKQIVPPLFDRKTAASLIRNQNAGGADVLPTPPRGVEPLAPPAPIIPFFRTSATKAAQRAISADYNAQNAHQQSIIAQRRADAAAYAAQKAHKKAAVDPSPAAQGAALAREEEARLADDAAVRARARADEEIQKADDAAARAAAAADAELAAQERNAARNAASIAEADSTAIDQIPYTEYIWPDARWQPPTPTVAIPGTNGAQSSGSMLSSPPLVAAGIGAVVGYLLGGVRGGALGALLGGGGSYAYSQLQHQHYGPVTELPAPSGQAIAPASREASDSAIWIR